MTLPTRWTLDPPDHDLLYAHKVDHRLAVRLGSQLAVIDVRSGSKLSELPLQPKSKCKQYLWSDGLFLAEGCRPKKGKRPRQQVMVGTPGFWLVGDDGPTEAWTITSFDSKGKKVWSALSSMDVYELRLGTEGLWVLGYGESCQMALLDPKTGKQIEILPFEGDAESFLLAGDRIVSTSRTTTPNDDKYWGVNVWERARGWHRPVDQPVYASAANRDLLVYDTGPATDEDDVLDRQTVAMRLDTHAELWRTPAGPNLYLAISNGEVAALSRTDDGDVVLALRDCMTGITRWTSAPLTMPRYPSTLLSDHHVYFDLDDRLMIFRRSDGKLLVDDPLIVDGYATLNIFVPFADGFVACRAPKGTRVMNELCFFELES